jgi:hypothetical protein
MLNNLKIAIRKKKLYFTVKPSVENIDKLYSLLLNNVITSFVRSSCKKKTSLIVFINYCNNFDSCVSSFSINSNKISKQQNNIIDNKSVGSNFVINTFLGKSNVASKVRKPKYCVKFR